MRKLLKMQGLWVLGALGMLCLAAIPAAASMFLALDQEALVANSDAVVEGKVLRVESFWDPSGRVILSEAEVLVDEVIAGSGMDGIITVQTFGGQVGDYHVEAAGFPRFEQGERVVLFLNQREALDGSIRVTGFQLGHYRIFEQEGNTMAAPIIGDNAHFLRDGREIPTPQPMPLSELKARVRSIETRLFQQQAE